MVASESAQAVDGSRWTDSAEEIATVDIVAEGTVEDTAVEDIAAAMDTAMQGIAACWVFACIVPVRDSKARFRSEDTELDNNPGHSRV